MNIIPTYTTSYDKLSNCNENVILSLKKLLTTLCVHVCTHACGHNLQDKGEHTKRKEEVSVSNELSRQTRSESYPVFLWEGHIFVPDCQQSTSFSISLAISMRVSEAKPCIR